MFGYDEDVRNAEARQIVVQEHETWIIACCQTLAHRAKGAIENPGPKYVLLAFELEFFRAGGAEEVSNGTVGRELIDFWISAVWAINPIIDPPFRPRAGLLRTADVLRLHICENQLHTNTTTWLMLKYSRLLSQ